MFGLEHHHEPGAHPAVGSERSGQFVGELFGDEHHGARLSRRVVEDMVEPPLGCRVGGARRADIVARGERVSMDARMTEPTEHVDALERGEVAEPTQPEPAEQLDQLGIALAECLQPADRQVGAELR